MARKKKKRIKQDTQPSGETRTFRDFTLNAFQAAAVEAIDADRSVLVSAPTGAGKTLIAEYAIEKVLEAGGSAIYTAPIKALSNQKYRDFKEYLGKDVGIMTGDVTLNPEAPLIIMTTEIFRNTLFERPESLDNVIRSGARCGRKASSLHRRRSSTSASPPRSRT
ncbi:MAG: DEAD/DEAH box helicase [Planctomycetota bacterium]